MKGVILGIAPEARLVDLTHEVPPQDVRAGAFLLRGAVPYFPLGTIHLAVVDPGVGGARRALVVATRSALFVAPDNGLLSLVAPPSEVVGIWDVSESKHRLPEVSRTFHGRDVFAPIAARLVLRAPPVSLGKPVRSMVRLPESRPRRDGSRTIGEVLWVDRFGNLITNIGAADLPRARPARAAAARKGGATPRKSSPGRSGGFRARSLSVSIGDVVVPLVSAYSDLAPGHALALVNSADLVEIAVNHGSASEHLHLAPGARVVVSRR
jgi:hypothetical protein